MSRLMRKGIGAGGFNADAGGGVAVGAGAGGAAAGAEDRAATSTYFGLGTKISLGDFICAVRTGVVRGASE